jgi:hypothetical protein
LLEDVTLLTRPDYEKGQSSKTEIGEALGHMISLRRDRYTKWKTGRLDHEEFMGDLLHEIEHVIQGVEAHGMGANPEFLANTLLPQNYKTTPNYLNSLSNNLAQGAAYSIDGLPKDVNEAMKKSMAKHHDEVRDLLDISQKYYDEAMMAKASSYAYMMRNPKLLEDNGFQSIPNFIKELPESVFANIDTLNPDQKDFIGRLDLKRFKELFFPNWNEKQINELMEGVISGSGKPEDDLFQVSTYFQRLNQDLDISKLVANNNKTPRTAELLESFKQLGNVDSFNRSNIVAKVAQQADLLMDHYFRTVYNNRNIKNAIEKNVAQRKWILAMSEMEQKIFSSESLQRMGLGENKAILYGGTQRVAQVPSGSTENNLLKRYYTGDIEHSYNNYRNTLGEVEAWLNQGAYQQNWPHLLNKDDLIKYYRLFLQKNPYQKSIDTLLLKESYKYKLDKGFDPFSEEKFYFRNGGYLQGPSHEQGGIDLGTFGGVRHEAEGGEYIISKKSVDKIGVGVLDRINKYGKLPKKYGTGGEVEYGYGGDIEYGSGGKVIKYRFGNEVTGYSPEVEEYNKNLLYIVQNQKELIDQQKEQQKVMQTSTSELRNAWGLIGNGLKFLEASRAKGKEAVEETEKGLDKGDFNAWADKQPKILGINYLGDLVRKGKEALGSPKDADPLARQKAERRMLFEIEMKEKLFEINKRKEIQKELEQVSKLGLDEAVKEYLEALNYSSEELVNFTENVGSMSVSDLNKYLADGNNALEDAFDEYKKLGKIINDSQKGADEFIKQGRTNLKPEQSSQLFDLEKLIASKVNEQDKLGIIIERLQEEFGVKEELQKLVKGIDNKELKEEFKKFLEKDENKLGFASVGAAVRAFSDEKQKPIELYNKVIQRGELNTERDPMITRIAEDATAKKNKIISDIKDLSKEAEILQKDGFSQFWENTKRDIESVFENVEDSEGIVENAKSWWEEKKKRIGEKFTELATDEESGEISLAGLMKNVGKKTLEAGGALAEGFGRGGKLMSGLAQGAAAGDPAQMAQAAAQFIMSNEKVQKVMEKFGAVITKILDPLAEIFVPVLEELGELFVLLAQAIGPFLKAIASAGAGILSTGINFVTNVVNTIGNAFGGGFKSSQEYFDEETLNAIKDSLNEKNKQMDESQMTTFDKVMQNYQELYNKAGEIHSDSMREEAQKRIEETMNRELLLEAQSRLLSSTEQMSKAMMTAAESIGMTFENLYSTIINSSILKGEISDYKSQTRRIAKENLMDSEVGDFILSMARKNYGKNITGEDITASFDMNPQEDLGLGKGFTVKETDRRKPPSVWNWFLGWIVPEGMEYFYTAFSKKVDNTFLQGVIDDAVSNVAANTKGHSNTVEAVTNQLATTSMEQLAERIALLDWDEVNQEFIYTGVILSNGNQLLVEEFNKGTLNMKSASYDLLEAQGVIGQFTELIKANVESLIETQKLVEQSEFNMQKDGSFEDFTSFFNYAGKGGYESQINQVAQEYVDKLTGGTNSADSIIQFAIDSLTGIGASGEGRTEAVNEAFATMQIAEAQLYAEVISIMVERIKAFNDEMEDATLGMGKYNFVQQQMIERTRYAEELVSKGYTLEQARELFSLFEEKQLLELQAHFVDLTDEIRSLRETIIEQNQNFKGLESIYSFGTMPTGYLQRYGSFTQSQSIMNNASSALAKSLLAMGVSISGVDQNTLTEEEAPEPSWNRSTRMATERATDATQELIAANTELTKAVINNTSAQLGNTSTLYEVNIPEPITTDANGNQQIDSPDLTGQLSGPLAAFINQGASLDFSNFTSINDLDSVINWSAIMQSLGLGSTVNESLNSVTELFNLPESWINEPIKELILSLHKLDLQIKSSAAEIENLNLTVGREAYFLKIENMMDAESKSILEREETLNELRAKGVDSVILSAYEAQIAISELIRRQQELNDINNRGRNGEIQGSDIEAEYASELANLQRSINELSTASENYASDLDALNDKQRAINAAKERELELIIESREELAKNLRTTGITETAGSRLESTIEGLRSQIETEFGLNQTQAASLISAIGTVSTLRNTAGIIDPNKYDLFTQGFGIDLLANTTTNIEANLSIISTSLSTAQTAIQYFTTELSNAAERLRREEFSNLNSNLDSWASTQDPMFGLQTQFQTFFGDFASLLSSASIEFKGSMASAISTSDFVISGTLTEAESTTLNKLIAGFNRALTEASNAQLQTRRGYNQESSSLFYQNRDLNWLEQLSSLQSEIYDIRKSDRTVAEQTKLIEEKILSLNKAQKEEIDEISKRGSAFDRSFLDSIEEYQKELSSTASTIYNLAAQTSLSEEETNTLNNAIEKQRELNKARAREAQLIEDQLRLDIQDILSRGIQNIPESLAVLSQYSQEIHEVSSEIEQLMNIQTEMTDEEFSVLTTLQRKQNELNAARQREIDLIGQQVSDIRDRIKNEGIELTQREQFEQTRDSYADEIKQATGFGTYTTATSAVTSIGDLETLEYRLSSGLISNELKELMGQFGIEITGLEENVSSEFQSINEVYKMANQAMSLFADDMGNLVERLQTQAADNLLSSIEQRGVDYTELDQINLRFMETIDQLTSIYSVTVEWTEATEETLDITMTGLEAEKEKVKQLYNAAISARTREIEILKKRQELEEMNNLKSFFGFQEQEMTFSSLMDYLKNLQSVIDGLNDTAKELRFSSFNLAPDREKLKEAQKEYSELLTEALAAAADGSYNQEAISAYQGFVNQYLQMNQDIYKSSQDYINVYDQVMRDLDSVASAAMNIGLTDGFDKFDTSLTKLGEKIEEVLGSNNSTLSLLNSFMSNFSSLTSDLDSFTAEDDVISKFIDSMEAALDVDTIEEWTTRMNGVFEVIDLKPLTKSFLDMIDQVKTQVEAIDVSLLDQITGGYKSVGSMSVSTGSMDLSATGSFTAASSARTSSDKYISDATVSFSDMATISPDLYTGLTNDSDIFSKISEYANNEQIGYSGGSRVNDLIYFKDDQGQFGIAQINSSKTAEEKARAYQAMAEQYGLDNVYFGGTGSPVSSLGGNTSFTSIGQMSQQIAGMYGDAVQSYSDMGVVSRGATSPTKDSVYEFGGGSPVNIQQQTVQDPSSSGFDDFASFVSRYSNYLTKENTDGSYSMTNLSKTQIGALSGRQKDEYLYALEQLGYDLTGTTLTSPSFSDLESRYSTSAFTNTSLLSPILAKTFTEGNSKWTYAGDNENEISVARLSKIAGSKYEDNYSQFETDFSDYYTAKIDGNFYRSQQTKIDIGKLSDAVKIKTLEGLANKGFNVGNSDPSDEDVAKKLGVESSRWQSASFTDAQINAPLESYFAEDNDNTYSYGGNQSLVLSVKRLSNKDQTKYANDFAQFKTDYSDYYVSEDSLGNLYRTNLTRAEIAAITDTKQKMEMQRGLYETGFNISATSMTELAKKIGVTSSKIAQPEWEENNSSATISKPEHINKINEYLGEKWVAQTITLPSSKVLIDEGGYSLSDNKISTATQAVVDIGGKMYVMDTGSLTRAQTWAIRNYGTVLKEGGLKDYTLAEVFETLGSGKTSIRPSMEVKRFTVPADTELGSEEIPFNGRVVNSPFGGTYSAEEIKKGIELGYITPPTNFVVAPKLNALVYSLSTPGSETSYLGGLQNRYAYQEYTGANFGLTKPAPTQAARGWGYDRVWWNYGGIKPGFDFAYTHQDPVAAKKFGETPIQQQIQALKETVSTDGRLWGNLISNDGRWDNGDRAAANSFVATKDGAPHMGFIYAYAEPRTAMWIHKYSNTPSWQDYTHEQTTSKFPEDQLADGGYLVGPSHHMGGIHIEAEGGEYVIRKDSVSSVGKEYLDYINKEGKLPFMNYALGGYVEDGDFDDNGVGLSEINTDSDDMKAILLELIRTIKDGDKEIIDALQEIEPEIDVNVYTDMEGEMRAKISAFRAELRERARRGEDNKNL